MRNAFADAILECAEKNDKIFMVVADISPAGSMEEFRRRYPDRFINVGVAEQLMIGISAGLAIEGFLPFAYTISTFAFYRPFEFIRTDLAYQNLPVIIVGVGSGLVYSTLGSTHHTQEDVSIALSVPNLKVLSPHDPTEVSSIINQLCINNFEGPVYLRLGKAGEPKVKTIDDNFRIGKIRKVVDRGTKIAVISYGLMISKLIKIIDELIKENIEISLFSVTTLKPLDEEGIKEILRTFSKIFIFEENSGTGGLISQITRISFEQKINFNVYCKSLKDEFIHCYGSHDDLLQKHELNDREIQRFIRDKIENS